MGLFINTNVLSINSKRNLDRNGNCVKHATQRLASGLRINSAKDDAAGLCIANRITSQINGLEQGNRNAQDGISYCQIAEGVMDEMTNIYQRIRTLAVQSANGTNSDLERQAIQQEVSVLCEEITRIGEDTTYGGTHILNKSLTEPTVFQVGAYSNETISLDLTSGFRLDDVFTELYENSDAQNRALLTRGVTRKVEISQSGNSPAFSVVADYDAPRGEYTIEVKQILDCTEVQKSIQFLEKDEDGYYIEDQLITYGAGSIHIELGSGDDACSQTIQVDEGDTINDIATKINKSYFYDGLPVLCHCSDYNETHSYDSRGCKNMLIYTLKGEDYKPPFSISTTGDEKLREFDCYISPESNINHRDDKGWYLYSKGQDTVIEVDGVSFQRDDYMPIYDSERRLHITPNRVSGPITVRIDPETYFSVETEENAQATIDAVDKFISYIGRKRAEIGAVQNRIESAINQQSISVENLSDARSRIRDVDYANESAELVRNNILESSSESILINANQSKEIILLLLQK